MTSLADIQDLLDGDAEEVAFRVTRRNGDGKAAAVSVDIRPRKGSPLKPVTAIFAGVCFTFRSARHRFLHDDEITRPAPVDPEIEDLLS